MAIHRQSAAYAIAVCATALCASLYFLHLRQKGPQPSPFPPASDADVLWLLQQEVRDVPAWQQRRGSHFDIMTFRMRERINPVSFARERLIARGSGVVGPLLKILGDGSHSLALREEAAQVLSYLDSPLISQHLADSSKPAIPWRYPYLREQIFDVAQPEKPLVSLDRSIVQESFGPGAAAEAEFHLLRWLNRIYDQDVDSWLAQVAPLALQFRDSQLGNGYDPVIAFYRLMSCSPESAMDGIKVMFSEEKDRQGCDQLLDAIYNHDVSASIRRPSFSQGWEVRVRSWYIENRGAFQYDMRKHRYVIKPRGGIWDGHQ